LNVADQFSKIVTCDSLSSFLFIVDVTTLSPCYVVPYYHGIARPRVVDGDGLQIFRAAVNILNKQSRTHKEQSFSLGVEYGANNSSKKN
jgi:hypothetical protein